jgi:hypothetical protein
LKGDGYGFLFRSEKNFHTTQELEYLFYPEFNIRLYDKTSESDYSFSLTTSYFTRVVCNIPVFQENASSLKQVLHSV